MVAGPILLLFFYIVFLALGIAAWTEDRRQRSLSSKSIPVEVRQPISQMLDGLPRETESVEAEQLLESLQAAAVGLSSARPPYSEWREALYDSERRLAPALRQMRRPMLWGNESLHVRRYFNGALSSALVDFGAAVARDDPHAASAVLTLMKQDIEGWSTLIDRWAILENAALSSLMPADEARVLDSDFPELRHGQPIVIRDPRTGNDFGWNTWRGTASRPSVLSHVAQWVGQLMLVHDQSPNIVCQLSTSGAPLATLLSRAVDAQLFAADNESGAFLPRGPRPRDRYLLVDDIVRTGSHVERAVDRIESAGGTVEAVVATTLNDLLLPDEERIYFVDQLLRHRRFYYFFKVSDLVDAWLSR